MLSLKDVWGGIDGQQIGIWKHDVMFCSLRFSVCQALFLTPLVESGDHPQAGQSWRTTSLFQGSLAQEAPSGGHDSLWLPVNLVVTVALLAHRLMLRLLPAHCSPRNQPWVSFQFSSRPWLILVLNLDTELMSARRPQAPVSFNLFLHQTFSFQKRSCLSNTWKPFFISLSLSPQFISMSC